MESVKITRPEFPPFFGGFGFHNSEEEISVSLGGLGLKDESVLRSYIYDSHNVPMNEFGDLQDYTDEVTVKEGGFTYKLLPDSLTVITSDYKYRDEIYAGNVTRSGSILSWDKVEDSLHCYYRVYRGETPEFVPSRENQIASTVAESLDFDARYLEDSAIKRVTGDYYKVISVNGKR